MNKKFNAPPFTFCLQGLALIIITSFFSNCAPCKEVVSQHISDCVITKPEFDEVREECKCKDSIETKTKILEFTKNSRTVQKCEELTFDFGVAQASASPLVCDFFYENSGSMDVYLNVAKPEFLRAVQGIIQNLGTFEQTRINKFYTSGQTVKRVPDSTTLTDFLGPKSRSNRVGKSTELNRVLNFVLDSALVASNKISFLLSDFEFSPKIAEQRNDVDRFFGDLIHRLPQKFNEYATLVCEFETSVKLQNTKKPIYLLAFGHRDTMLKKIEMMKITSQPGYKKFALMMGEIKGRDPYYTVLRNTGKVGDFKVPNGQKIVHTIENVKQNRNGQFKMSLAVDLSGLPIEDSIKLLNHTYECRGGNFSVDKVQKLDLSIIHNNDRRDIKSATHVIEISLKDILSKGSSEVKFCVKKDVPKFRLEPKCCINDLIDALQRQYNYETNNTYYSLPINIKN